MEDFWKDAIVEADSDYFIGSFVVFKERGGFVGIVDGQQRLTTITMTLSALRNAFQDAGFEPSAKGLHGLIERKDIEDKQQFVLQTETSYPYLQEHIQKWGPPDAGAADGQEQKLLREAFEYITSQVKQIVAAVRANGALSESRQREQIQKQLTSIRERVLKLKLILIELDNEDDAYIVFETLNTRGKDLSVADLVKNTITKLYRPGNRNVDRAKDRWAGILKSLEASQSDLSFTTFLHHYWLSLHEYITEKKLFKAIRKTLTKDNVAEFVDALEREAKLYREINEPSARRWRQEQLPLKGSLEALAIFKVRQPLPMVLSVMREYQENGLPVKHVVYALRAIEHFHFIFTAVTSQRSSGGISFMYALHARQLHSATTLQKKVQELRTLTRKLREKLPSLEEFEADFARILCSEVFSKQKKLAMYVLRKMTSHYLGSLPAEPERLSIEHIEPQANGGKGEFTPEAVAMLGNLVLVDEETNKALGSKRFADKKRLLLEKKFWVDDYLKDRSQWGASQIMERTRRLAQMAFQEVWKF